MQMDRLATGDCQHRFIANYQRRVFGHLQDLDDDEVLAAYRQLSQHGFLVCDSVNDKNSSLVYQFPVTHSAKRFNILNITALKI